MPQPLPSPILPKAAPIIQARRMGEQDQIAREQRGALQQAGTMAAEGSLSGARKHLLRQGLMDEASHFQGLMEKQSARGREQAQRLFQTVGRLAGSIKSPEQWEQVKPILREQGLDVDRYSFEDLPMVAETYQGMLDPVDPVKVGDNIYDPNTQQWITPPGGDEADLPSDVREYQFARQQGYEGSFTDYQKQSKAPLVDMRGESEFAKKYGGALADKVTGLTDKATAASDLAGRYRQIEDLLTDEDVYTGAGGPLVNWGKKVGATLFGQEQFRGVEEAEAAEKTQKLLVGKIREMMGDQRMSDADRQFYSETIPNIGDSPRGITLTTQLAKQAADHARRSEAKALEIMDANNGVMTPRAWSQFRNWQNQQSIFDPKLMQMARREAKKTQPRGPGAGIVIEMDGRTYRGNPQTGEWEVAG